MRTEQVVDGRLFLPGCNANPKTEVPKGQALMLGSLVTSAASVCTLVSVGNAKHVQVEFAMTSKVW